MFRPSFPGHRLLAVLALLGGVGASLRVEAADPPRDQQIAEIEKQLADLQKQLADLKSKKAASTSYQRKATWTIVT